MPINPRLLVTCACVALLAATAVTSAGSAPQKTRGLLVVAVGTTGAPYAFLDADGETVLGLDADIAQALAAVLGYRLRVVEATPDAILPGLASGRYDLGMSLADTRAGERDADLLGYLSTGTSFVVRASGGPTVRKLADLCGRSVAVVRGTAQAVSATAQSTACKAAGKLAVKVTAFGDPAGVQAAVAGGRAQVALADSAVAGYAVKQSRGRLELTGSISAKGVRAIAIARDSGMAKEFRDALATLMDEGTYETILAGWGAQNDAIGASRLNAARR